MLLNGINSDVSTGKLQVTSSAPLPPPKQIGMVHLLKVVLATSFGGISDKNLAQLQRVAEHP